jgi:hypothetical protein
MVGVLVHLIIGFILFTPIGFIVAAYQYKKGKEKEFEEQKLREKELN